MQDKLMIFHVSLPPSLPSSLPTTDSMYSTLSPSLPICIHTSSISDSLSASPLPAYFPAPLFAIPPSLNPWPPDIPSLHTSLTEPFHSIPDSQHPLLPIPDCLSASLPPLLPLYTLPRTPLSPCLPPCIPPSSPFSRNLTS